MTLAVHGVKIKIFSWAALAWFTAQKALLCDGDSDGYAQRMQRGALAWFTAQKTLLCHGDSDGYAQRMQRGALAWFTAQKTVRSLLWSVMVP
jgi:hypothetical protein